MTCMKLNSEKTICSEGNVGLQRVNTGKSVSASYCQSCNSSLLLILEGNDDQGVTDDCTDNRVSSCTLRIKKDEDRNIFSIEFLGGKIVIRLKLQLRSSKKAKMR